jgi:hypothetical protein
VRTSTHSIVTLLAPRTSQVSVTAPAGSAGLGLAAKEMVGRAAPKAGVCGRGDGVAVGAGAVRVSRADGAVGVAVGSAVCVGDARADGVVRLSGLPQAASVRQTSMKQTMRAFPFIVHEPYPATALRCSLDNGHKAASLARPQ